MAIVEPRVSHGCQPLSFITVSDRVYSQSHFPNSSMQRIFPAQIVVRELSSNAAPEILRRNGCFACHFYLIYFLFFIDNSSHIGETNPYIVTHTCIYFASCALMPRILVNSLLLICMPKF